MNVGDKVKVNWNYDERKLRRADPGPVAGEGETGGEDGEARANAIAGYGLSPEVVGCVKRTGEMVGCARSRTVGNTYGSFGLVRVTHHFARFRAPPTLFFLCQMLFFEWV